LLVRSAADGRDYNVTLVAPHAMAMVIADALPGAANRFAVNLGAGDGVSCNDPVYPLYQAGYGGLAIEGGANAALAVNLPSPSIRKLAGTFITPANIASLLQDHGCPRDPDFLKLDIDGYDGPVLRAIFEAGFRPKVLQLEVQPEFPPPLAFAVHYHPDYRCVDDHNKVSGFYGASLAYMADLGRRYGYFAAQIDFITAFTHDVTLVDRRYASLMQSRFGIVERPDRELFLARPPGYSHFQENGVNSLPWRAIEDPHALLASAWDAAAVACGQKHGRSLPFHLELIEGPSPAPLADVLPSP
jgi:hypothetical protein